MSILAPVSAVQIANAVRALTNQRNGEVITASVEAMIAKDLARLTIGRPVRFGQGVPRPL